MKKKYPEIGEVTFTKYKQSKRFRLSVNSGGKIKVSMPFRATYKEAESFLAKNFDWIKNNLKKIEPKIPKFELNKTIKTKFHQITIKKYDGESSKIWQQGAEITIFIPQKEEIKNKESQNAIQNIVNEVYRIEAKNYIPKRIGELAKKHNFSYKKVKINSATTRWGSCSHENNINISLHTLSLPYELIDYILLHELCHTVEKNHSKKFWDLMKKVCPKLENHKKALKKYNIPK